MEKTILHVEGMSCSHCENAVKTAVGALEGVSTVEVDLNAKTVKAEHDLDKTSVAEVKDAIEDQGYDVVSQ